MKDIKALTGYDNRTMAIMDNLDFLRTLPDECIDLIYNDPQFSKNETWIGKLKTPLTEKELEEERVFAQLYDLNWSDETGTASFTDVWAWDILVHLELIEKLMERYPLIGEHINNVRNLDWAAPGISGESMAAYLGFMAVRLAECYRVLAKTGSIFLHCDHTAGAYLKNLMDIIFGGDKFRNQLIWRRTNAAKKSKNKFGVQHDVILFYVKSESSLFYGATKPLTAKQLKAFNKDDNDGKGRYQTISLSTKTGSGGYSKGAITEWRGVTARWIHSLETREKWWEEGLIVTTPSGYRKKDYLSDANKRGIPVGDLWVDDIPPLQGGSKEYTGYPTQKPLELLDRIILATSNPGDIVLDCFAGCATTIVSAHNNGRQYLGCDISIRAMTMVKRRFAAEGVGETGPESYEGTPALDFTKGGPVPPIIIGKKDTEDKPDYGGEYSWVTVDKNSGPIIVQRDYNRMHSFKERAFIAYGNNCWACGEQKDFDSELHVDHIKPISHYKDYLVKLRSNNPSRFAEVRSYIKILANEDINLQLLCAPCNLAKGAKIYTDISKFWNERNTRDNRRNMFETHEEMLQFMEKRVAERLEF